MDNNNNNNNKNKNTNNSIEAHLEPADGEVVLADPVERLPQAWPHAKTRHTPHATRMDKADPGGRPGCAGAARAPPQDGRASRHGDGKNLWQIISPPTSIPLI